MIRSPRESGFTLIEMITVIAVIVILVGLVLVVNGLIQHNGPAARAVLEIRTLSSACEAYKTDNGGYPQDTSQSSVTNTLDPRANLTPSSYYQACGVLYTALSGMTNVGGVMKQTATNYAPEFFKAARLAGGPGSSNSTYMVDPWGNSYGYSTAGLGLQQEYQAALLTNPQATMPAQNTSGTNGYNTTFDLWSTGGTTGTNGSVDTAKWVKNW
ncbi:MAG TPA: prepilin-type N-terminal cleavage/methylation domain-containing protein [Chthoniobacter sp.]|jgi:prepilin-type N-terminal cleavage/methylation domain-containing protein